MKYLIPVFILLFSFQISLQAQEGKWRGPQSLEVLNASPVALIPFPQKVEWTRDKWALPKTIRIEYNENDANLVKNAVRALSGSLSANDIHPTQHTLTAADKNSNNTIVFKAEHAPALKPEGYSLTISPSGIVISASDSSGFYYGVQTLMQIITQNGKGQLPGCKITDWPAFGIRGFMHDTGRNFQTVETLKAHLDILARYKFNTFHWHLTDNPAWRPESKLYPQLNDPKNRKPGRNPEQSYSFDEIREVIAYAGERSIRIIPELDMPGHSAYFKPTFGFKMETEEGMKVLENLIDEFCREIPVKDAPIIHLGSDEVHIPNPEQFIQRMTARVKANGRKVMVWNPGLPPVDGTIEQIWIDDSSKKIRVSSNPYVDSYAGYLNSNDALSLIQRYFFQQVCNKPQGDSQALGGILCAWPDTRVEDKSKIPLHNPVWPGSVAYSEAIWAGRPDGNRTYMSVMPAIGTEANNYFREFENRLSIHRQLYFVGEPFPYVQFGNIEWQMIGPFRRTKDQPIDMAFDPEKKTRISDTVAVSKVTGGVLRLDGLLDPKLKSAQANETVYLKAYIFSAKAKQIHAMTGFEVAARSNRRSAGIPPAGKWDANGGAIFVNGKEPAAPVWQKPGANRYLTATWDKPANEIPYEDEEFYWSRLPAAITLKKGWNEVLVRVPRTYKDQAWMFAFVPVKKGQQGRWVEDLSVKVRASKDRGR